MLYFRYFRQHKKKVIAVLLLLILIVVVIRSDKVQAIIGQLTPQPMPELIVKQNGKWIDQVWLDQNWGDKLNNPSANTRKYHHISQGTRTIPLPYEWFVNIEQPSSSLWLMPFSSKKKFVDNDYLLRIGFIRSKEDLVSNPDGLPIGFARTFSQNMTGINGQTATVGFTCAACHTSHFVYDNGLTGPREYIVEGGPATTDFGLLQSNLTAAIGQLVISAKVPFLGGRFDRFAHNVLGNEYSPSTKEALSNDLVAFAKAQLGGGDQIRVTEGFTRLDALNRIGNAVFSENIGRPENKTAIDAPVNYPHIWTTSWFDWVQYDASVMGPLIRNVGEALGVKAFQDVVSPMEDNRFSSSIPIGNLVWIERFLAGPQPTEEQGFQGLQAPKWSMTDIDQQLVDKGRVLYQMNCQGCHLPPIDSKEIWDKDKGYIGPIVWYANGVKQETKDVLKLKILPLERIGTDRSQAKVMVNRTMNTSGNANGTILDKESGMQIDSNICARDFNAATAAQIAYMDSTLGDQSSLFEADDFVPLTERWVTDGANVSFGYALAATVEQTINAWFNDNGLSNPRLQEELKEGRPNCIQAGMGYKARPLNGVWATPPFLHNGSVATIRDLLCPVDGKRLEYIQLGNIRYDTDNLGVLQPDGYVAEAKKLIGKGKNYDSDGFFILDTNIEGNRNTGHHFSDSYDAQNPVPGVIGPKLSPAQCDALLEYLKVL
ncbi:di-heme-cytochrome C peroxidase [Marinomonas sp. THO17]|uniref:di-heme-cytochrome C peroxidase n=1 Tax=Marinomonas sp. THO17 TaxID=3149048 RepID=UPI00336C1038